MTPKAKENPVKVAIWLPESTRDTIRKEATAKGLTFSALARMILIAHADEHKKEE